MPFRIKDERERERQECRNIQGHKRSALSGHNSPTVLRPLLEEGITTLQPAVASSSVRKGELKT